MDFDVNWLAVLVATIGHQAVGALWYGVLFRDVWLKTIGMNPEEVQRQTPGGEMIFGIIASVISVVALALILTGFEDPSLIDGIALGALTGIGFVTAATFMNGAYEQKKPLLSVLFGAYYTVGLMIAGAIVGGWR